ncbi:hypothetical protein BvCmsKKP066_02256 [Escherichia coli]|nr:hypothetical protein BvCmsKKP066_02256 [Escherichia coli]
MAIKEHSLLFIHTQTPRKRNNPFHSSVLCTHPGGRFLRDFSRRGQLAKNASNANSPGFISIGISWIFRGLASSASRRAQVSNCLCRMISSSCVCVSCIGDSVLLVMLLPCKAMRRSTSRHGADVFYPLGSIPRCCNSFRSTRLIQVAKEVSPSAFAASSSCALNSSGSRIWYGGDRFSNGVDMVITLNYYSYMVITIVLTVIQKTTPRSGGSHMGRLTKPLIEVTIMAIKEHSLLFIHTQTPRKRNNPFHSSVLCTHPGGRFLRDFSRRGQLAKNASNANSPGFIFIGISWIFRGLASSASRRAQVSNCLCRMISSSCVCVSCIGDSVLLVMILPCKAMRRSTSHHGADSDYSDSLALRRWRYSTSRFNAAVTNCPVLSPGIFTPSTLFITSCGTLAATVCDFAFTAFVAMLSTPHKKQMQYAGKKTSVQHLTCLTPRFKLVFNTLFRQGVETTKPRTVGAVTGLLTNNVNEEPLWLP